MYFSGLKFGSITVQKMSKKSWSTKVDENTLGFSIYSLKHVTNNIDGHVKQMV